MRVEIPTKKAAGTSDKNVFHNIVFSASSVFSSLVSLAEESKDSPTAGFAPQSGTDGLAHISGPGQMRQHGDQPCVLNPFVRGRQTLLGRDGPEGLPDFEALPQ